MSDNTLFTITHLTGFAHLVDGGRSGGQINGYTQSGAADWVSFQLANALLGNELKAPAIEVTMGSITFVAKADLTFAIGCVLKRASEAIACKVDGLNVNINHALKVTKGQSVEITQDLSVNYYYVSISAHIDTPRFHNSVCSVPRENTTYLDNILSVDTSVKGSAIAERALADKTTQVKTLQNACDMDTNDVFFHYCYQHNDFAFIQKQRFTNSIYRVGSEMGKMGVKLEGPTVMTERRTLLSEGICLGAIQVSADGQPMILLNNRQTIGGYPKIGVLGTVDCAKIAQKPIGKDVCFTPIDVDSLITRRLLISRLIENLCRAG